MLLSERERARKANERFKRPDRLLKVRLSMARLQGVLEERKRLHLRLKQYQKETLLNNGAADAATSGAAESDKL